jgi:hypothetical protein
VVDEEVVGNSGINDHVVNISREANGVYIATVEVGDNILEKKKFAILRGG